MRRKRRRRLWFLLFIPLVIFGFLVFRTAFYEQGFDMPVSFASSKTADESRDWNLILINSGNRIPKNYKVELVTLSNGKQVDSRIYPDLQTMFDDARASGLQLFVREGYRTKDEQQKLLDDKIASFRNEGYSQSKAEKLAREWVAVPGTSEHEIGIAVDINADTEVSSKDEVYRWLQNNSYKYGFIWRYPEGKSDITGISNEPWHYRYVGKEAAKEMYERGLCLEEYLMEVY